MKRGLALAAMFLFALAPAFAAPTAIDAMRKAASAGDAEAQFQLAQAYQLGRGVTADGDMALLWYRRAVAQGHARASDELGFALFSRGERRAAMPYIEKAAARGDARAFYLLGTAHFNGDLASRDWPLAYAQTARAVEGGLVPARANLQMMEQYLQPADRAKADAILATLPPVRRMPAATAAAVPAASAAPTPVRTAPPAPAPVRAVPAAPFPAPAPSAPPPASAPRGGAVHVAEVLAPVRSGGSWKVQLGAFGSADRAKTAWDGLGRKVGDLAKLDRAIVAAGPYQRLQATGIASRADAQALCAKVKAAGSDCMVVGN